MNMKILIKIKRNLISLFFLVFLFFLVVFSNTNLKAAKIGLTLWSTNVIPSLFPFFVAVELLKSTNIVYYISLKLDKYMKPIFNSPGVAAFPLIMGLISGYPIGAKIVSNLYETKCCTKQEAERMLPFTNNSGPLFILGTVGTAFYDNSSIGLILLITHILSAISVGIIFGIQARFSKLSNNSIKKSVYSIGKASYTIENSTSINSLKVKELHFSNIGVILSNAIFSAIKTTLMIGGFVVTFSVIVSILKRCGFLIFISKIIATIFHLKSELILGFMTGILECTNGLNAISLIHLKSISINIILSAFIIGFGGFSVFLQVLGIVSQSKLSTKLYLKGKLLQAFLAALYTYLILLIPFLNLNI